MITHRNAQREDAHMTTQTMQIHVYNVDNEREYTEFTDKFVLTSDALSMIMNDYVEHMIENFEMCVDEGERMREKIEIDCDNYGTINMYVNNVRIYRIERVCIDVEPVVDDIAQRYVALCA
jgi:short-subunit dehydrogenase involved in D-alanine esterification of teichoic acids